MDVIAVGLAAAAKKKVEKLEQSFLSISSSLVQIYAALIHVQAALDAQRRSDNSILDIEMNALGQRLNLLKEEIDKALDTGQGDLPS